MVKCTSALIDVEREWLPDRPFHALYLRPVSVALDANLDIGEVEKMMTYICLSPVGPYFPEGFKPVKLMCDTSIVRSWPKGYGHLKLSTNYAPTMRPMRKGREAHGADTSLWLLHDYVLEMGSLNAFVYWKNEDDINELITPPLDGTILPGITRDSILNIARDLHEFKVTEKAFKVQEMVKAVNEGRMYEMFGSGTAALVASVH